MKNILLIGVGGTGSKAVDIFYQKRDELGNQTGNKVTALVFDTDAGDAQKITAAKVVPMADPASVGTICDRLGSTRLHKWFPSDNNAVRAQEMIRGASQWRKKSYLAFLNLMNKPNVRQIFISALEGMVADPGASCEIYIIASIAGGTGSGSFIPIALYAKRYLRKHLGKDPIVNAMIALPDIYANAQTPENRIKVYSNAYAILRELNAINLVSRDYNKGTSLRKKAPIKFVIGDPDDPNVGVLFDASDPQYWSPEAAPFSQIFLLDRIPGLNTVTAHDIVLANSLYTILCTEIGAAFESELSNHELLRSQNNGSNAIYAGISTSQVRFPKDSVLDYLAHKKTLDATDSEWLVLHKQVQQALIRKRNQAAESGQKRFTLDDSEYAEIVLEELANLEENGNTEISDLVDRGTAVYEDKKKLPETTADRFCTEILEFITGKIALPDEMKKDLAQKTTVSKQAKVSPSDVTQVAQNCEQALLEYFTTCVTTIKSLTATTADAIFTLDKKKEGFYGTDHSLIAKILNNKKLFLHPVTAMVQLCRFRKKLANEVDVTAEEWSELTRREVDQLPDWALEITSSPKVAKLNKSTYFGYGKDRFSKLVYGAGKAAHATSKTDARADLAVLGSDVQAIADNIYNEALVQFRMRVAKRLLADVDLLIKKYDSFFTRFEKEKEDLVEAVKMTRRKDSEQADSVLNVYSREQDKDAIMGAVFGAASAETASEMDEANSVVGIGAWNAVFSAAAAERSDDGSWDEKNSATYRDLFSRMVEAYRGFIQKTEIYGQISSYNAIEAIVAAYGGDPKSKDVKDALRLYLSKAQELAIPSLRVDRGNRDADLVNPSDITVFMISYNTGKYIKKHAEEFELTLPADQVKEGEVVKSCAEQFLHKYSGSEARVSIVSSMPDQVLYCTGEIMDITPLRIDKFDELGSDNVYFKYYCQALENLKLYGTDMWNPHLGNDLHKRGYLPYMNEQKEKECDEQLVKALIYAFGFGEKKLITLSRGMADSRSKYFFTYNGQRIQTANREFINNKNIAQLLAWLRNEEDLVKEWSALFDQEISREMNALPNIASDNSTEIGQLEAALTESRFVKMITDYLYVDETDEYLKYNGTTFVPRLGPTLIEFAHMVKTSEESGRDCDDAERILRVVYNVFMDLCEHRASPDTYSDRFIQVYKQQIGKFYEALANANIVVAAGAECRSHYNQLTDWLNKAGVFNTIAEDGGLETNDADNGVTITTPYIVPDGSVAAKTLTAIANSKKRKAAAKAAEEPQATEPAEEAATEEAPAEVNE